VRGKVEHGVKEKRPGGGRRLAGARRTASPRRPPRTYDPRGGRRMVMRIANFAPGGHEKPLGQPPRITV
jgi:hypothetical protein